MEEEAIYDFGNLRHFLEELGYLVGDSQGWTTVVEEFDPMAAIRDGSMQFRPDGIYIINPKTKEENQVFIYKHDYWLHQYGEQKPRFHICKCSTIEEFMRRGAFDGHYVRANIDPVPVISKETHREEIVSGLPLCRNCIARIHEYGRITSTEFAEILREARGVEEDQKEQEVDIFGYTRDWDEISRNYREKHEYTCEKCGLKIDDLFDRQYIHCHHKDANKLNNNVSNLQCLCLRCHSQVDEYHRNNLTSGANGIIFRAFEEKYPPQN